MTATLPCASNWDVDINYQNSSGLIVYYDFQKIRIGVLNVNDVLGASYYPPNKNKVFAVSYTLDDAAEGSTLILELLKNGSSLGTPVLITIPAQSYSGYLDCSQTEFLTTDTCSLKVNQVGSTYPGNNICIVLHSYHTT